MAPSNLLAEFVLPISSNKFLQLFWLDVGWYEKFLINELEDLNVAVSPWKQILSTSKYTREVKSFHPSQISFPGLPSHAESRKTQTYELFYDTVQKEDENMTIIITESDELKGIPYADYFSVQTEWKVTPKGFLSNVDANLMSNACEVIIRLNFKFHKSTWLQGTIESNSRAELLRVYELWLKHAMTHIENVDAQLLIDVESVKQVEASGRELPSGIPSVPKLSRNLSTNSLNVHVQSASVLRLSSANLLGLDDSTDYYDTPQSTFDRVHGAHSRMGNGSRSAYLHVSDMEDDEDVFYDCEDPSAFGEYHDSSDNLIEFDDTGEPVDNAFEQDNAGVVLNPMTSRDIAIAVVEGLFVMVEFIFWTLYRVYMYELKEIFYVRPQDVADRVFASWVPGRHHIFLKNPDLYGPLLAVFLLPQVLLLSMELSMHGCSQSALLGNTVVISICIWICLSTFYRLLAYCVSPWIEFKHCLCIVGYSFFSWSAALLLSYPLEHYQDVFKVPSTLPLIMLGGPAAIAQGYIFWEYVPNSSLKLFDHQSRTYRILRNRWVQSCARANSSWMEKALWIAPKVVAFVVIAGTHYQLLWYISRVFLPGKRQLCALSALIQPSRYADILTQKELLKFATDVLQTKQDRAVAVPVVG